MKKILLLGVISFICSCSPQPTEAPSEDDSNFSIASSEYADLHEQALNALTEMDIETWAGMLADDVEYYFPDGDVDTRTSLMGKEEVVVWWENWKNTSGVQSMTVENANYIPINTKTPSNTTGVSGVFVISYFSNSITFDNGSSVSLRMNYNTHWNENKKIDRFYTYYDRTPIIEAMERNILSEGEETEGGQ